MFIEKHINDVSIRNKVIKCFRSAVLPANFLYQSTNELSIQLSVSAKRAISPSFAPAINLDAVAIMRPSSLGGAAYCVALCPSVCLSVCLSVRPVIVTERHVAPPSELQ